MSTLHFETIGSTQRFRVAELGSGRPVVLLHGFPDTPQSWEQTATLLADQGHRVIVPYLRGYHPDTVEEGRTYGAVHLGGDVIELLDVLGVERAALVGHDWGASCVWNALDIAPERIGSVTAIGIPHPSAVRPSPRLLWLARHFIGLKLPFASTRIARNDHAYIDMIYRRWSPEWTNETQRETVARAKTAFADPVVNDHAIRWYADLDARARQQPLEPLPTPGLLVAGEHDFGGDIGPYEATLAKLPDSSELLVVPGAGHWPHREAPDVFHEALLAFLGSTG